jgi:hypothetical protein
MQKGKMQWNANLEQQSGLQCLHFAFCILNYMDQ